MWCRAENAWILKEREEIGTHLHIIQCTKWSAENIIISKHSRHNIIAMSYKYDADLDQRTE